ncbi:MAG: tRNA guanosine(34) transglycosylase Tgt [Spirochaeta sp. LUC14_002_19_P3]|nr:MAG: tRNA guanosine(34) transglycosylase Tgt [Spirochaeta sp. LUC14_002_19_P3]
MLTVIHRDNTTQARSGFLKLPHGKVEIPAFMPVGTNGTVKAILHSALSEIGFNLILGNTYHLYLRPGMDVIERYQSLHRFSSWKGNILTDSGGYQIFSLAQFRKIREEGAEFRSHIDGSLHQLSPESAVDIQCTLNSDIQMQLDVCTAPGISEKEAAQAMELSSRWALRAKRRWMEKEDYRGVLFAIVQGNFFRNLREESAHQLVDMSLPGYAIGGLSVGEEPEVFKEFLHFTAPLLPDNKPKYVMGIGTPDYMLEAIEAGIDLFDCVHPTRAARNGSCFTPDGMLNLRNARFQNDTSPLVENCPCPACRLYSRGYLRHLFTAREILGTLLATHHNLQFVYSLIQNARTAISKGSFSPFKKDFLARFGTQLHE